MGATDDFQECLREVEETLDATDDKRAWLFALVTEGPQDALICRIRGHVPPDITPSLLHVLLRDLSKDLIAQHGAPTAWSMIAAMLEEVMFTGAVPTVGEA